MDPHQQMGSIQRTVSGSSTVTGFRSLRSLVAGAFRAANIAELRQLLQRRPRRRGQVAMATKTVKPRCEPSGLQTRQKGFRLTKPSLRGESIGYMLRQW